ncbi:hypothetical protein THAOC_19828, partial [Thalassiosira oceanica]
PVALLTIPMLKRDDVSNAEVCNGRNMELVAFWSLSGSTAVMTYTNKIYNNVDLDIYLCHKAYKEVLSLLLSEDAIGHVFSKVGVNYNSPDADENELTQSPYNVIYGSMASHLTKADPSTSVLPSPQMSSDLSYGVLPSSWRSPCRQLVGLSRCQSRPAAASQW